MVGSSSVGGGGTCTKGETLYTVGRGRRLDQGGLYIHLLLFFFCTYVSTLLFCAHVCVGADILGTRFSVKQLKR